MTSETSPDEMTSTGGESARGTPWAPDEDERLVEAVRAGMELPDIAARHGRSLGSIAARLRRMIPRDVAVSQNDRLDWVLTKLTDPTFDWRASLGRRRSARRRSESSRSRSVIETDPEGVADIWQRICRHTLTAERRAEFLDRPTVTSLTRHKRETLLERGQDLWRDRGRLLLDDWALECERPGLTRLSITADDLITRTAGAGQVIRDLVAATLATLRDGRDREVLERRLGLPSGAPQTLESIAADFGVTRERIRQRQERGLQSLGRSTSTKPLLRKHTQTMLSELFHADEEVGLAEGSLLMIAMKLGFPEMAPALAARALTRIAGCDRDEASRMENAVPILVTNDRAETAIRSQVERLTVAADAKVGAFLSHAEWPARPTPETPPSQTTEASPAKSWFASSLGRLVGYISDRELSTIRALDRSALITWFCERPMAVPFCIGGRDYIHHPNLIATSAQGQVLVIEVCRLEPMALILNQVKFAATRRLCLDKGWGFLVTEGTRFIDELYERVVDPEVRSVLTEILNTRPLRWETILTLRQSYQISGLDLAALILQNGWHWQNKPTYRITLSPT